MLARGKTLESQIRAIRDLAEDLKKNPLNTLRDLPKVEKSLQDVVRIQRDIESMRQSLTQYRVEVVNDRDRLLAAKTRDLARINEIKTDRRLNGRSLSQLLIGDSQGRRVDQAISWIKWLRKTFPHPKESLQAERGRGQTIRFPGQVDHPDLLIRSLKINGQGTMEQKPYTFTGTVAGLTTQPEVYGKPAFLQLTAEGNMEFTLKGTIDRSQPVDRDRLIIEVPGLKIASQDLKIDDAAQLLLERSQMQIKARVELVGDRLSGQIKATQQDFDLQLLTRTDNRFARQVTSMLNEDLGRVEKFEVVARISGTLDQPNWHLHSDLGPQLSEAIQQTLVRCYETKKTELIAKLERETEESLEQLIGLAQNQERRILAVLQKHADDIVQLRTRVANLVRPAGLRFR